MILSIETSTNACSIALHNHAKLMAASQYRLDKSHSGLLPTIIQELLNHVEVSKQSLEAIAVSAGPGSYTGLRIGVSVAKALTYALQIPLIAVDTLDILTATIHTAILSPGDLIIPLLDARRMEVYAKVVDEGKNTLVETHSLIVDQDTFNQYEDHRIILLGNGASKTKEVIGHPNSVLVEDIAPSAELMGHMAYEAYTEADFQNLAYFEPIYLKEFQTKKSKDLLRP